MYIQLGFGPKVPRPEGASGDLYMQLGASPEALWVQRACGGFQQSGGVRSRTPPNPGDWRRPEQSCGANPEVPQTQGADWDQNIQLGVGAAALRLHGLSGSRTCRLGLVPRPLEFRGPAGTRKNLVGGVLILPAPRGSVETRKIKSGPVSRPLGLREPAGTRWEPRFLGPTA